jgi:hypothetical protein
MNLSRRPRRELIETYNFYSMVHAPMTTCGCCECIAAMLPSCNGVMTVNRDYSGETPSGMKFTTLAGVMGGGASPLLDLSGTPSSTSPRRNSSSVMAASCVWSGCRRASKMKSMTRLNARGKEMGVENFADMIADETIGITEDEIYAIPPGKRASGIEHGSHSSANKATGNRPPSERPAVAVVTPDKTERREQMALTGIQIFKLLPKTNCKECGVPTCLAFAMNLASGKG